ncbi:MAG: DNA polymerase I [Candidatus Xenobia bacterium]
MTETLFLFDGNGLAFRAFYGSKELTNTKLLPVHAILGFAQSVLKLLDSYQPEYAAMAFDLGKPTKRLESFAQYKAQRQSTPEGFSQQMPYIRRFVDAMRLPVFYQEGYEADDCIGTLTRLAEARGLDVAIVSADLDMLQLVTPHVRVLALLRHVAEPNVYDLEAVRKRFGLEPAQIPDWKALAGDTSDNIPGVAGIGENSASKLLAEHHDIEQLIAHLQDVPEKWRKKLEGQEEAMRRYRELACICTGLKLDPDWEKLRRQGFDGEALAALLDEVELPDLKKRLKLGRRQPPTGQLLLIEHADESEEVRQAAAQITSSMPACRPCSPTEAAAWLTTQEGWIGLERTPDGVVMASEQEVMAVRTDAKTLRPLLRGHRILAQNVKSLLRWLGLDLPEVSFFDFQVASYLLHSGLGVHSLDAELKRLNLERLLPVDTPEAAVFAMAVAHPLLAQALEKEQVARLMTEIEVPLAWPLAAMEEVGIQVNLPYLSTLGADLDKHINALSREVYDLAGCEFNLNSPKQVGEVLFDRLQLAGGKKTKTGWATGVEVLQEMAAANPIVEKLLSYREVSKLKSTYVEALPKQVDPRTGRVHTTFNQTVAATGRLSSSDPNLQNIPIRSELGKLVRQAFIPGQPEHVLLSADYSQIELRILAHVSQDIRLVEAFKNDEDVHAATAKELFGEVSSATRRKAKEINFGIMYGMSGHGLAQRLGIGRKEAQEYITRYLERFSGVRDYLRQAVEEAEQRGWVGTLMGRRRYLPDIRSRNFTVKKAAERMAVNAPIQGTAADLIKLAMIEVYKLLRAGRMPGDLLLQVHDELLLEVPECKVAAAGTLLSETMANVASLAVPLKVDVSWGRDWADMHEVADRVSA